MAMSPWALLERLHVLDHGRDLLLVELPLVAWHLGRVARDDLLVGFVDEVYRRFFC